MIRAAVYLAIAGLVWIAEGFMFSRFLAFSAWQTALMVVVYCALFAMAAVRLVRALEATTDGDAASGTIPAWRIITAAPMLAVVIGSFVSLPVLMAILALGKIV